MTAKQCREPGCRSLVEAGQYCEPHRHGKPSNYARGCRCPECIAANSKRASDQRIARLSNKHADIPHGIGGYTNHGCRCDTCRAAQSESNRAYRESRSVRMAAGLMPMEIHGTSSGYNAWSCRCEDCTQAHTDNARRKRKARVSALMVK